MNLFEPFYKRHGVRTPQQLVLPPQAPIEKFSFPRGSVYHYVSHDGIAHGPEPTDILFADVKKQIYMDHITELTEFLGSPKKLATAVLPYIRAYHTKNKRFRYVRDAAGVTRDEMVLVVNNYGFLPKLYRYIRSFYTEYYKWYNISKTMWEKVAADASVSPRHHFVVVDLPKTLPSLTKLELGMGPFNQNVMKSFDSPESLFLLEMWKWLSEDSRKDSVLDVITPHRDKINIVFMDHGKWTVLNLGLLNSWRYIDPLPGETEVSRTEHKFKIHPVQLQKYFLRMMMGMMNARLAATDAEVETDGVVDVVRKQEDTITTAATVLDIKRVDINDGGAAEPADNEDISGVSVADTMNQILTSLDEDLAQLDALEKKREAASDDKAAAKAAKVFTNGDAVVDINSFGENLTPEQVITNICDKLADDGLLTAAEYKRYSNAATAYKNINAPMGSGKLGEFIKIDPKDLEISKKPIVGDISTVPDKSMLHTSLSQFDSHYITKLLHKDIASMVVNTQKAGVVVANYDVQREDSIMGSYEMHAVRLAPVDGMAGTVRFKLPVVGEDGVYMSNGIKYRMRKQRGDLPIRKIAPDTVALTSYYGKTFVTRNNKKVNSYSQWLQNIIMSKGLDMEDRDITNLAPANVFDNHFKSPRVYSIIAMSFKAFTASGFTCVFDHKRREVVFGEKNLQKYEVNGSVMVGFSESGEFLIVDKNDTFYKAKEGVLEVFGRVEKLINTNADSAPFEFCEVKVYGKQIPVGMFLAYRLGLTRLLELLKVNVRRVPVGTRATLSHDEYSIVFADETLIFFKDDILASMILGGFNDYRKALRLYDVATMDKQDVYLNLLESNGINVRYLNEMDHMDAMFIDPITEGLLKQMGEPTNFGSLLVRAASLLLTDRHPDALDMRYMRIKGYERLAGAVYAELVQAVREHKARRDKRFKPVELHPHAVWKRVVQDPSISLVSEINPIKNLKEMEAVTFSGTGGRNSRSMTKQTRAYHPNDMGVISESTVDNSDVSINTYLSADPKFNSIRGTADPYVIGESGIASLISTTALVSVGSDRDDPKRTIFAAIQHDHGIACASYKASSVRTGYESVIAHRVGDLFAYTAKEDGEVVSKSATGIVVQYASGVRHGIEIGRRFGVEAGLTLPHDVVSDLKVGDVFKKDDIISYNEGFFERDILNPSNVVWKIGMTVKTALYESNQTHEDASSISKRLAEQLATKTVKVKTIVVAFDQNVKNMVKVGDSVEPENILCIIEDPVTSKSGLFSDESLNTLRLLSNQAPTAKVKGVVDKIEVFYHGSQEDMTSSLVELAQTSDNALAKRNRSLGLKAVDGSVDADFRVEGDPLMLDSAAIRIYITSDVNAGVGDKGVFGNQLKTVFSEVMNYHVRTETGEEVDAIFGAKSVAARIVTSPFIIGTANVVLDLIGKNAVKAYKGLK